MNRRSFLKILGLGTTAAAAAALTPAMLKGFVADPERVLWVPGRKTIVLPPSKTFTLYTLDDLRALERGMGVLEFYGPKGEPRLLSVPPGFAKDPHAARLLHTLGDCEVQMAIETGRDLDRGHRHWGIYSPGISAVNFTPFGRVHVTARREDVCNGDGRYCTCDFTRATQTFQALVGASKGAAS